MRLIAEAQPGCDPETLRERMPEALAFVREWVRRAGGDELQLLPAQAFEARIEVAPGEVQIRVEVPLIEAWLPLHEHGYEAAVVRKRVARLYLALSF